MCRNVYDQFHVKKGKLIWKAFEPPAVPPDRLRSNEISTIRPKYAIEELVTFLGNKYAGGRNYAGFARVAVSKINKYKPDVWVGASPYGDIEIKICLCSHADILCNYLPEYERAVPPEYLKILKEISENAQLCHY